MKAVYNYIIDFFHWPFSSKNNEKRDNIINEDNNEKKGNLNFSSINYSFTHEISLFFDDNNKNKKVSFKLFNFHF